MSNAEHHKRSLIPLAAFTALVSAAWVFPFTPASRFILCPFRWLLELSCPGCGMTRSVIHFVRGDLVSAFVYHPAGPLLVTVLGLLGGLAIADRLRKREHLPGLRAFYRRQATRLWTMGLVALLVFWALRLVGELQ